MDIRTTHTKSWVLYSNIAFLSTALILLITILFIGPWIHSAVLSAFENTLHLILLGTYALLIICLIVIGSMFRVLANKLKDDFLRSLDNQKIDLEKHHFLVDCVITVEKREIKSVVLFSSGERDEELDIRKFLSTTEPTQALALIGDAEVTDVP